MIVAAVAILGMSVAAASAGGGAGSEGLAMIAFSSGGRILTIEADGSDRTRLTGGAHPRTGRKSDFSPVFSPNRGALAFVRVLPVGRRDERSQIYLMDADGSDQRALTPTRRAVFESGPSWSADGKWVAFTRQASRESRFITAVVLIRPDGTGEHRVVTERIGPRSRRFVFLGEPAPSPDGDRLAYTRTILDRDYYFRPSLRLVNTDGTGDRRLKRNASDADWSPDGSRIAFVSVRDENGEFCGSDECSYSGEIYVMSEDGTGLVRLTRNKGDDGEPDWSADGSRIAFSSDRNFPSWGGVELYSVEPDGSCLTWLTNGSPDSSGPDWEPDPLAATDPGACGATPRPPLVETDWNRARRVEQRPILWLGETFRGLILSDVSGSGREVDLGYFDCARYDPGDCRPSVDLQERSTCRPLMLVDVVSAAQRVFLRRGVVVAYFDGGAGFVAYTGDVEAKFYLDRSRPGRRGLRQHLKVFRALRRLGHEEPGRLPPPAFPRRVLRELRKTEATVERLGSVDTAHRELRISRGQVRNQLRLRETLEDLGRVGRTRC